MLKTPVENAPRTSIEKHLSWSPDIPPAACFPLHRSRPAEYQPNLRAVLQQCKSLSLICRNVHCKLPQCITSVHMWSGGCNLGLPSLLFALQL